VGLVAKPGVFKNLILSGSCFVSCGTMLENTCRVMEMELAQVNSSGSGRNGENIGAAKDAAEPYIGLTSAAGSLQNTPRAGSVESDGDDELSHIKSEVRNMLRLCRYSHKYPSYAYWCQTLSEYAFHVPVQCGQALVCFASLQCTTMQIANDPRRLEGEDMEDARMSVFPNEPSTAAPRAEPGMFINEQYTEEQHQALFVFRYLLVFVAALESFAHGTPLLVDASHWPASSAFLNFQTRCPTPCPRFPPR
jgi:hypothetical protein